MIRETLAGQFLPGRVNSELGSTVQVNSDDKGQAGVSCLLAFRFKVQFSWSRSTYIAREFVRNENG